MISTRCRLCGADIAAEAQVCGECGARVSSAHGDFTPAPGRAPAGADPNWQLVTWLAMGLAAVATVALLAIAVATILSSDDAPNPATTSSTSTTFNTTLPGGEPFDLFDYPVREPVTIRSPRVNETGQYYGNGAVVTFVISDGVCGGGGASLSVSGSIRNESKADQPLRYVVGFDLIRAFTGSKLAHVETEVGPVSPGETVPFDVAAPVGQVVTLRCDLTEITVLPAD